MWGKQKKQLRGGSKREKEQVSGSTKKKKDITYKNQKKLWGVAESSTVELFICCKAITVDEKDREGVEYCRKT